MKISVVVPTHNRPLGVVKAINSLFLQERMPDEIVVVDDGSFPKLKVENLPFDPNNIIKVVRNDEPRGAPYSRNLGARICTGDIICFLDDDDCFRKSKLALISNTFEDRNVELVTSWSRVCLLSYDLSYLIRPAQKPSINGQLTKNLIGTTSMLCVRKSLFLRCGGFDESLVARQDYELGIRLLKMCQETRCIPKVLVNVNVEFSDKSISKAIDRNIQALDYIDRKYRQELGELAPSEKKYRELANNNFIAHKMIISGALISAIVTLLKGAAKFRSLSSLLAGLSLCLGRRMFFKLLSIRNR